MRGSERLSSSSLTVWPFDQASNVPPRVSRLFSDCSFRVGDGDHAVPPSIGGVSCRSGVLSARASAPGGDSSHVFSVSAAGGGEGYSVVDLFDGAMSIVVDNEHVLSSEDFSDDGEYPVDMSCADAVARSLVSLSIWNPPDDDLMMIDSNGDVRDGYLDMMVSGGLRRGRSVLRHGGPVGTQESLFIRCPDDAPDPGSCVESARIANKTTWASVKGFPVLSHGGIMGDVAIAPGRNIRISTLPGGGVEISASPGAGEGRVPCECQGEGGSGHSTVLKPDEFGGVSIVSDGCYQVTPFPGSSEVRIDGRCSACCPVEGCVEMAETERAESDEAFKAFVQLMHERYYAKRGIEKINYGLEWNVASELDWACGLTPGGGRTAPATCVKWDPELSECSEYVDLINPNVVVKIGVTKTFEKFDFSDTNIVGRFERVSVSGYVVNRMRKSTVTMTPRGMSATEIAGSGSSFVRLSVYEADAIQNFTVKTPSGDVVSGRSRQTPQDGGMSLPVFVLPPRSVAEFTVVFRKSDPSPMSSRAMLSPRTQDVEPRTRSGVLVWVDFLAEWTNMLTEEDAARFDAGMRDEIECEFRSPVSAYVDNFERIPGSNGDKEDDRYVVVDDDFDDEDPGDLVPRRDRAYVTLSAVLKEDVSRGGVSYNVYYDRMMDPDSLVNGCYVPESFIRFWEA